ncbi:hypothetical protein NQ317_000925 [Molorchus minor]|uniref:Uncharacterized protein n=1 Tax=Molorchus minor TaxID=1323400 RepID=A0ABQ9K208_9CUCU|nr:hypothetical protein NQ317_000925 [Molorchus minor]
MAESSKVEDLGKLSMIELKDILHRENELLKNSKLINKLPDKGESIKLFRARVEKEIEFRDELGEIEESFSNLPLGDKHEQKLYCMETAPRKERYKPFATLNKTLEVPPESNAFKLMEDCSRTNKPVQMINLPESIEILKEQDEKVKEEQMRAREKRLIEKLLADAAKYDSSSEYEDDTDTEY